MQKEIVFFVSVGRGFGYGHWNRSRVLAHALKENIFRENSFRIVFFVEASQKDWRKIKIKDREKEIDALHCVSHSSDFLKAIQNYKPDLVILDRRNSSAQFLKTLRKFSLVFSFDDLGAGMFYSNLTIEALPRPAKFRKKELKANYSGISYLFFRESLKQFSERLSKQLLESSRNKTRSNEEQDNFHVPAVTLENFPSLKKSEQHISCPKTQKKRVLVSFGSEDPFRLTEWILPSLKNIQKLSQDIEFRIILGPLYKRNKRKLNIESSILVVAGNSTFEEELFQSDFVLTSFGLTVYEALLLGKKVLTLNCSPYHNSLAQTLEGIHNLGTLTWLDRFFTDSRRRREIENFLKKFLLNPSHGLHKHSFVSPKESMDSKFQTKFQMGSQKEGLLKGQFEGQIYKEESQQKLDFQGVERVLSIIESGIQKQKKDLCSICGLVPKVIDRTAEWNFYHCYSCHCFFRSSQYSYREEYSDEYFTKEYQRQYGKTYAEDRDRIEQFNRSRLKKLLRLCPVGDHPPKLLELGTALGFFLNSAKGMGYEVEGVEVSSYAVKYAKKELQLSIQKGDFRQINFLEASFDLVVAWYFIEHHRDFISVLRKMSSLLKEGGILALSTPNTAGISFWSSPIESVHRIPKDHYIEFSPRSLSLLLEKEGFFVQKIVMTGVHPIRLAKFLGFSEVQNVLLKKLFYWVLKIFRLGDTFEIYAKKRNS